MKRHFKTVMVVIMLLLQILADKYRHVLKINVDLLYLILIYFAVKSGPLKTIALATVIGWVTDFFSGGLVGVFGFARVLAGFVVHESARFLDLTRIHFVFFLIALSLAFSNFVANVFFHFVYNFEFEAGMLLYQPLITGVVGVLLINLPGVRQKLDVY